MTYTINDFTKEYYEIKKEVPSYRIGQQFCCLFLRDSSTNELCRLWEELDEEKALVTIYEIIERYNWDYNDLPLLKKEK